MYCSDYDDVLPWPQSTKTVKGVTMPYIKSEDVWKTFNPNGGQFRFNMCLGGVSMTAIEDPAATPIYYESMPWPDGKRVVAFSDGHAKVVTEQEWHAMRPKLSLKLKKAAKKPLPKDYVGWTP